MINVIVKYHGKPLRIDKKTHEEIKHIDEYTIDEYDRVKDSYESSQQTIKKEVTKIFKKYKGIYCIKFYVHD